MKNDWFSGAREHSEEFEIHMNLNEIQLNKVQTYCERTIKTAFEYLLQKQECGNKNKLIRYESIKIDDYMLPECSLSVSDKR